MTISRPTPARLAPAAFAGAAALALVSAGVGASAAEPSAALAGRPRQAPRPAAAVVAPTALRAPRASSPAAGVRPAPAAAPPRPAAPARLPLVKLSDFHRVSHYSEAQLAKMTVPSNWRTARAATMQRSQLAYVVRATPDQVWAALTKPFPAKVWNSAYASFRVGFEPGSAAKLDPARWRGFEPGQRVFLDLHGIPHTRVSDMAIGVQVTRFDPVSREISFEYTAPTPSVGEQRVRLVPVRGPDGRWQTRIEHSAEYSGGSKVVQALYPAYHEKIWSAYYRSAMSPIAPLERVDHR